MLMLAPSASLSPVAPVEPALSDPAKSIRFILETSSRSGYPFSRKLFCLKTICVTVCAREDVAFILVDPIVLFTVPISILL